MSETTQGGTEGQQAAPLMVNAQYVKDLSFEIPNAPMVFTVPRKHQPQVSLNLDVQARRIDENQPVFEVTLAVRAEAKDPDESAPLFICELSYAGLFTLGAIPPQQIEPVLLIECPRLLFPFARNLVADLTRDGGFPPVLLQPIDFVSLWQARRAQAGNMPGNAPSTGTAQ